MQLPDRKCHQGRNAMSRENILHQYVSFGAKKNRYKDKIQR